MKEYVRKIGSEKKDKFQKEFDTLVENYTLKAKEMGYEGKLKFKIEKGMVIIFVVIE